MKKILFILFFFPQLSLLAQVDLVFPKNNYVFDSTKIHFSWNAYEEAATYEIQIATDSQFNNIIEANNSLTTTDYTANNLVSNTHYSWRVKAHNSTWSNTYKFKTVDFRTWSEIEFILDPDSVVLDVNGKVKIWKDLSSNNHDFVQNTPTKQPKIITDSIANLQKVIDFDPTKQNFLAGNNLDFLSKGEIFALIRKNRIPPTSGQLGGIWRFGSHANPDYYPSTNNQLYSNFGSTERKIVGIYPSSFNLRIPFITNIQSQTNEFNFVINKVDIYSTNDNVVSFTNTPFIGASNNNSFFLDGQLGKILLFNTILNDSLREVVYEVYQNTYTKPLDLGENISIFNYSLCESTTIHAPKGYNNYLWSDGSTKDSLIVNSPGKYWCEVTDVFGFKSSDTIRVNYASNTFPSFNEFCPNSSLTWKTQLGNDYTYLWSDNSTDDSLVISAPGDYYVLVTDSLGCTRSSDTLHFSEDTFHQVFSLGADTTFCVGNSVGITAGEEHATSLLWNTGETTTSIQPQVTGEYSIIATNVNGCIAKDTLQVTILGNAPTADFTIELSSCTNEFVTFNDQSTLNDASPIESWEWDFGEGSSANTTQGTHHFGTAGNYTVSLTVNTVAGCSQTATKTVSVFDAPEVHFTSQFNCQGATVNFMGTQTSSEVITQWNWDFDDVTSSSNTSTGQNTSHVFTGYGNHTVQLIGTDINGCKDTVTNLKNILPQPIPDFTFEDACMRNQVLFTNQSTMPDGGNIQGYIWDFGNGLGSQFPNPQAQFNNAGTYEVKLKALGGNGCNQTLTKEINIHALPTIAHFIEQNCAGVATIFKDNSHVDTDLIESVSWRFNSGASIVGIGANFEVSQIFNNEGPVSVQQTVTTDFGCVDSTTFTATIGGFLQANFTTTPDYIIADVPIMLYHASIGANWHQFTTNLGSTLQSDTSYLYSSDWLDSTVFIQLVIRNNLGCTDTLQREYIVQQRNTDLAITNVIAQEFDGYLKIGAEIKNNGSTPISTAHLKLERISENPIQEEWSGLLQAGESEVYVFHTMPLARTADKDAENAFLCVTGTIIAPAGFPDENESNNSFCITLGETEIGLMEIYPNPINEVFTLQIIVSEAKEVALSIYDENGKSIQIPHINLSLEKGLNAFQINTHHWNNGVYFILVDKRVMKVVKR